MIFAIDGPAASGKGTIARRLAQRFDLPHLDTGLLYRAVARALLDEGAALDDEAAAVKAARALALTDFDEQSLRGEGMGDAASVVAAIPAVRAALIDAQRNFANRPGGAVLDGRDIATAIAPAAEVKIFVVASPEVRAQRRALELRQRGENVDFRQILADILRRDERDGARLAAPLRKADDAVTLDTSKLDVEGAVAAAIKIATERMERSKTG